MNSTLCTILMFIVVTFLPLNKVITEEAKSPNIDQLIIQLDNDNAQSREDAASSLAKILNPKQISPAVKKRLAKEDNFHVKLALHYALASQGEKESLSFLIDSLKQTGHMGANYLRFTIGEDFGWDIKAYQKWYEKTSEKEFHDFINERWRRKPMMEEYAEFTSLFSKQYFGHIKFKDEEQLPPERQFTVKDKEKLASLPTAQAWTQFQAGLTALQGRGDRKEAAQHFRKVATDFSNTFYADQSRDLADQLDKMLIEDQNYKKPENIDAFDLQQQIAYHIYHLRDVVAYQMMQPGYCHVLHSFLQPEDKSYNAAKALRAIGEPALPSLINLLTDRRPIRGIGYWRDFHPTRTVLRYQDAAIQIIDEILPKGAYVRRTTSSYFSIERPEKQQEIIEALKEATKK